MNRMATANAMCTILVATLTSIVATNANLPLGVPELEDKTVIIPGGGRLPPAAEELFLVRDWRKSNATTF